MGGKDSGPTTKDLMQAVQRLQSLVEGQRQDDNRQQAFDQLYEELRQYKDDFIFQAEKPLLLDLLLFHDSLCWFKENLTRGEVDDAVVAETLQYLVDEFLELLYRRDVVPVDARMAFNRTVHKAIKVVPTDDPAQDHQICQIIKRGFLRGDKLLRPEEVVISRLGKPDADDTE